MSRQKETRQERTQYFHEEVNEDYFLRIVDFVEEHRNYVNINKSIIS